MSRTYRVTTPLMSGNDIERWQQEIVDKFAAMHIGAPLQIDGTYGPVSRERSRQLMKALGMNPEAADHGVTPDIRRKLREIADSGHAAKVPANDKYRDELRDRWGRPPTRAKVSKPVRSILGDSWDYHPGVHDGIDVITMPDAPLLAMVRARVIDVRTGGWWGLGAQASQGHPVSDGDGIVQLEVLDNVGPFKKGYHIGYGHCEKASVKVGQIVEAGQQIAHAGFANVWHIHLMYNNGSTTRGVGNVDPRAILNYAKAHG